MYARESFAGAPGSSGEIGLTLPSGSLLLCSFCSAVNSHRSTAAAARSRHQSTLARDQTYAPVRYIARAHPSIPQGKSSTGILAPAAYNESPIVAFQLAAARSPLTCFTDPLPEEGSRSAPIANRLWAPRAGPMVDRMSEDYLKLTGETPTSMADFVKLHAAEFTRPSRIGAGP